MRQEAYSDEEPDMEWNWNSETHLELVIHEFHENAGITEPVRQQLETSEPLAIFKFLFNDDIMEAICRESNLYASQVANDTTKLENLKILTVPELWRFYGVHLLIGLIKKPTIKEYWSIDPLLKTSMFHEMRNRFQDILLGLHFADNKNVGITRSSRFWKLGEIEPSLIANFKTLVVSGDFLSIDESLLKYNTYHLKGSELALNFLEYVTTSQKFQWITSYTWEKIRL